MLAVTIQTFHDNNQKLHEQCAKIENLKCIDEKMGQIPFNRGIYTFYIGKGCFVYWN